MGWFKRKPHDLIADSTRRWEHLRDLEELEAAVIRNDINPESDAHLARAFGGWCAPSDVIYDFLDLPEISIRRGGIKWPTT